MSGLSYISGLQALAWFTPAFRCKRGWDEGMGILCDWGRRVGDTPSHKASAGWLKILICEVGESENRELRIFVTP